MRRLLQDNTLACMLANAATPSEAQDVLARAIERLERDDATTGGPKTYIGERHGGSDLTRVLVDDGEVRAPLEHYIRHSPTGFEWGYGGSGPSDLARCILIDHFRMHKRPDKELPVNYQDFKADVICNLPREGFELTSKQIGDWIIEYQAR